MEFLITNRSVVASGLPGVASLILELTRLFHTTKICTPKQLQSSSPYLVSFTIVLFLASSLTASAGKQNEPVNEHAYTYALTCIQRKWTDDASQGTFVTFLFISRFLELQNKVHSHVEAQRHILVLGWSDKTLFLVRELFRMLSASRDGGTIVILGEVEEMDMLSDLRVAFPTEARPTKVSIIVRRGFPCELDDLERVAVEQAHSTIILAAKSLEAGDRATLETVLAIQGLPTMSGSVVCEVCMERSLPVLRRVAGPESLLVLTNSRVDKALAVTAFLPSLGTTLAQLMVSF